MDASSDGSVIATVPFHTMLPTAKTDGKRFLFVTNKKGKVLFQKALPSETPYVDVSNDGKYVTVTSAYVGERKCNAIIYDKSGTEVYRTPDKMPVLNPYTLKYEKDDYVESYCAVLSNNNNILAYSSTDGGLWLIDWKNNKILSQTDIKGQLRTIDFSKNDDLVYVTGGGGYAYCIRVSTGEIVWKSFIQTWATQSILYKNYYIVTTKNENTTLYVLNASTGKKIWDYPTTCRGSGISVSPDGKKLWWGTDNGTTYTPLNNCIFKLSNGKLLQTFTVNGSYSGMQAAWSKDSKSILIKNGTGFGVYNVKTGEAYYEKKVVKNVGDSLSFSLYASSDLKYVVAGFNDNKNFRFWGKLYFFERTGK